MSFEFITNPAVTATFIAGIVMLIAGFIVYGRDKDKKSNLFFLLLSLSAALWSITLGLFEIAQNIYAVNYLALNLSLYSHLLFSYLSASSFLILCSRIWMDMTVSQKRSRLGNGSRCLLFIFSRKIRNEEIGRAHV